MDFKYLDITKHSCWQTLKLNFILIFLRNQGPTGVKEMVETVMRIGGGWEGFPLEFFEIPDGVTEFDCGSLAGLGVRAYRMVDALRVGV